MSALEAKSRFPRRFTWGFGLLFLISYWPGLIGLPFQGAFKHVENAWQDKLFSLHQGSLPAGDPRIVLAAIDDGTVKQFGFPLPRSAMGRLIDKLKSHGAKVVVFDVLFIDPREGDAQLNASTKRAGNVVHLYLVDTRQTPMGSILATVPPVAGLDKVAAGLGYPNVERVIDSDGHLRRMILFDSRVPDIRDPGRPAQSVDTIAYSLYTGVSLDEVQRRWGTPISRQLDLNFRAPRRWLRNPIRDTRGKGKSMQAADLSVIDSPYQHVAVGDILSGQLTAEQRRSLKGALVMVGSTALAYYDHYPSPFTEQAPGPEFHCNILDNMLHDDFVRPVARGWIILAIIALIALPLLLQAVAPATAALAAGGVLLGWWVLAYIAFRRGLRLEFVAPSMALTVAFLAQTVHRVLVEGQEKKRIKGLFGQFVAPEVVEDLARNPEKARLGGEKKDMTMLFLDIAHFTTISEKMPPEALIVFLNRYLSALSQVVLDQKAVVGNYIGDCIMAFWNAPILAAPDHRARACLAAIECQAMVAKLNEKLDPALPIKPAIRIGINSGIVTVGLTGSEKKLQYTVLGDEVNLSSRLEGANKFFGSAIMVSESTYEGAKDLVEARELGRVRVVGKETPIRVFEMLSKKGELSPEWRRALEFYNKGLEQFIKRSYDEAVLQFQEVVKIFPEDGPAALYLNAARDYAAIPPDENWDGVFNLTAK